MKNLTKKIGPDVYEEKTIGSYTLMKKAEKEAKEKAEMNKVKALFLDYLKFYEENYPKSTRNNEWKEPRVKIEIGKEDLQKELDKLSEKQLYDLRYALNYSRKEHASKDVREHEVYDALKVEIDKRIPGLKFVERLEALQEKEKEFQKEKETLIKRIEKEREEFSKKRLQPKIEPKKEETKKEETKKEETKAETSEFICKTCGKLFKNAAGLGMHSKTHEK